MPFSTDDPDVPPHIAEAMANNTERLIQPAEAAMLFDAVSIAAHEGDSKHG